MTILERLKDDMIEATKARDSERLGVIRFVRSEMKYREIELGRDLKDEDAVEVLSRVAKRHRESIEQFSSAGRDDLVANENIGLAVVSEYLPEQLNEDALASIVDEALRESGATSMREIGLVMKAVMPKVKGRADGKVVKAMVQMRLAEGEG
ncbi:GatB/YqeY domain-containing protein [bacterium]|nr:GatB/YqeY domain-containing protein [bacterium]